MNGKVVYFSLASLLSVLCLLQSFLMYSFVFLLYLLFLLKIKRFSFLQLIIVLGVFLLFFISAQIKISTNKTIIPKTESDFYIKFTEDPKIDGDMLQITGKEIRFHERIMIRYRIPSRSVKEELENTNFYGYVCKIDGQLKKPQQAKNENAFNYREYLKNKGIFWIVDSKEITFQKCTKEKVNRLLFIKKIRFKGINYLQQHFPPEIAALSSALIFGDRDMMDPDVLSDYQKAGIIHLLAISGLHVSLFIGMLFFIGLRLGATKEFMTHFILVLLPIYAVLTGGSPSVLRAVFMIFIVMAVMKWRRVVKIDPIDSIGLAFSFLLLINPLILLDVGFQLSFSVTFAVILSVPLILQRYQSSLAKLIATSIIAQFSSLPFLLFHFYQSSMISIIANLLFIPFFSFVLLPGIYLLFFFQLLFGLIPLWIIDLFIKLIHLSTLISRGLARISIAQFIPGRPSAFFLFLYTIIILLIFVIWERKHFARKNIFLISLIFLLFTFQVGWNRINPYGEVSMIDVGQGDCILIHLPFNKGNYLIDTGGTMNFEEEEWKSKKRTFEVGKDVVVPYLKSKGITKIDKLILTHGDMDHIGGSFAILKELKVKQILMPSTMEESTLETTIKQEAKKNRIPVVKVSEGVYWRNKNSSFYILSPEKNFKGERNRGSIAIYAEIGGLTWFFGGDLDQEGEENIIKKYPDLSFDVLKVGHHGSKTSSSEAFLNQSMPKISLLSVGEKNRYGHPNHEVITKLHKIDSTIYRTDKEGGITYRFYHKKGTFSSHLP
jgi:competence protein ComEC